MSAKNNRKHGTLIIIGGHEDKDGDTVILEDIARRVNDGCLVVVTAATEKPENMAAQYTRTFGELGVKRIEVLDIREREHAYDDANVQTMAEADVVFFTGGDQLRITSLMGDSLVYRCMEERYHKGATIAGTSAGAAAMSETMLIGGPGDESNRAFTLKMAPGLGLLTGVVIDTHFAERGRIGRILGVVAQNPRNLGIGIDEDTAIIVQGEQFDVIGSGGVYVADGSKVSYSSLKDNLADEVVSIFNVALHVLRTGDHFHLDERKPFPAANT